MNSGMVYVCGGGGGGGDVSSLSFAAHKEISNKLNKLNTSLSSLMARALSM